MTILYPEFLGFNNCAKLIKEVKIVNLYVKEELIGSSQIFGWFDMNFNPIKVASNNPKFVIIALAILSVIAYSIYLIFKKIKKSNHLMNIFQ